MRFVLAAAPIVAVLAFGSPGIVSAQQPRRSPSAAPAAQAPAERPAPRDRAVPRDAAVPRAAAPAPSPRSDAAAGGARSAPSARASAADDQERPGAVRRPPSDAGRGSGQTPRDRAVVRRGPPPRDWDGDRSRGRDRIYYYPSYWSYGRYYDPYYYGGFHLGYLAYSPWGWTPAFYGYPYPSGGYGYSGYGAYGFGALKLKVKPRDAEVYVDGYFAGNVDDFDGVFQSLKLETGGYRIEIRKPGFETLTFDVHVQPDRTITYRGEMQSVP